MGRTLTKEEIFELSVSERLELIETLWDSISPEDLPVPESHQRALDEALDAYRREPEAGKSWEQVRDDVFRKQ